VAKQPECILWRKSEKRWQKKKFMAVALVRFEGQGRQALRRSGPLRPARQRAVCRNMAAVPGNSDLSRPHFGLGAADRAGPASLPVRGPRSSSAAHALPLPGRVPESLRVAAMDASQCWNGRPCFGLPSVTSETAGYNIISLI
jgi:hypothetical protein